jgi:hypothetical protein
MPTLVAGKRAAAPVLATFAALVLTVGSVAAVQPASEPFADGNADSIDCGGFTADFTRTYSGTLTTFFNKSGDPTRIQFAARLTGSLSGNGKSLPLSGSVLVVIDLVRGTFAYDGTVVWAGRQGDGVVFHDSGRFLVGSDDTVLLDAGPHDLIENGADVLCAALA